MLQKLKYFIEVAQQQSFTKAADTLFISQPALSKQMRLLEEELGFSLFNRSVRGVKLTEKGKGLYQELRPLFTEIEKTVTHYQGHDKVRFGSTPFLSSYFLHEFYGNLERANFYVTAIRDDSQDLLPLLENDEIDGAIIQDVPTYKKLRSTLLFKDEFVAAIPVSFHLASKEEVSIDECMMETQIIPPEGSLSEQIRAIRNEHHYKGKIVESHYHAMAGLVSLGVGIAYLPSIMVKQIEYKGVVFLPIQRSPLVRHMYLYATTLEMLDYLQRLFTK
ncbi:LysR family transcriptional regulator [Halobacillus mangrovi]|uniref:LysR family transcriptional regulator n=1 Tax=Halobacillus mangrovi TaxID=402384 RepID=UPI003D985B08